ncbi:MAG: tRNA (N6-isopentenyl adenosine(37)-C2)-methylthiotransferase MiaB [Spirochaetaceae bacterium]|nr:tRNA (N6-isopentenyl adenosine(37)-C2)-methylthiotransferase MiaB [Spirochaetaceae bacterium]
MKYYLETYGCQMNKAESSALEEILREKAWEQGPADDADLILVNTCTVRATAENRAWGRIAQFAAGKKDYGYSIAIVGCMAEQYKETMKERVPEIDYVVGTYQKQSFGLLLDQIQAGTHYNILDDKPVFQFSKTYHEPGAFRDFVPIMHGCNNFCTYCIVPYVRGREVSRAPADILSELDTLEDLGVREITLLGQNVNSYSWQDGAQALDFPALLRLIAAHLHERHYAKGNAAAQDGIGWIRFLTSHPKDLSPDLIDVLATEPLFCKHVHLCVQSGSDRILALMNRKYTREYFLDLVGRMKASIPGLSLSTDILVGFPGETEEDLDQTLDVMRRVEFAYSFMYHFNPREGTSAVNLPGKVPDKVKKARLAKVIALQKETTGALMRERIGCTDQVLIEGQSKKSSKELVARTARDEMVVFRGDASRIGQFAKVRLAGISGNTFKAEELHE